MHNCTDFNQCRDHPCLSLFVCMSVTSLMLWNSFKMDHPFHRDNEEHSAQCALLGIGQNHHDNKYKGYLLSAKLPHIQILHWHVLQFIDLIR